MNLSQKFALFSSSIVFIILSTFTLLLIYTRTHQITSELKEKDRITSVVLRQDIGQYFADYYFYQYDQYKDNVIKKLSEYPDVVYFRIFNTSAQPLFDSKELSIRTNNQRKTYQQEIDPFIETLIKDKKMHTDVITFEGQQVIRVIVHYIDQYDVHRSTFEFYFSTRSIRQAVREMIVTFMVLLLVFMSLSIGVSFGFIRQITRPVSELTKAAGEFAKGNLDYPLNTSSGDEIGELSSVFGTMAQDLKVSEARLKDQNKYLEEEVKKRTLELSHQVDEMSRIQKVTIDRELKMIELKKVIEDLKAELAKLRGQG